MQEQGGNITVQEIDYNKEESDSQVSQEISSIKYEEQYQYLNDGEIEEEYMEMKNISLEPSVDSYNLTFYQIPKPQSQIKTINNHERKIGRITMKKQTQKLKTIKLPSAKKSVMVEVQTDQKGSTIIGESSEAQNQSTIYNSEGKSIGTLKYQLKHFNNLNNRPYRTLEPQQPVLEDSKVSLHSKDFEGGHLSRSIDQHQENDLIHDYNRLEIIQEEMKDTIQKLNRQANSNSNSLIGIKRRKKIHREGVDKINQEGQNEVGLEKRVGSFRMPLGTEQLKQVKSEVDMSAIRRYQQELGISNINIENIIYPQSLRQRYTLTQEEEQQLLMMNGPLLPQLSSSKTSKTSKKSKKSVVKQYCELGVGTYSKLQSFNQTPVSKTKDISQVKQFKRSSQKVNSSRHPESKFGRSLPRRTMTQYQGQLLIEKQLVSLPNLKKSHIIKRLSLENKVIQIQVEKQLERQKQFSRRYEPMPESVPVTHHKISKKIHHSCKDSPINNRSSDIQTFSNSDIDPIYDLKITNLSLNFQKNTFGNKYIELVSNEAIYSTEQLKGNNLIWIGKSFVFSHFNSYSQLVILVKSEEKILGKVKLTLSELLLNKKQNYYQCLVLSEQQVIGYLIIGYQISKDKKVSDLYNFKQDASSATQLKKKKMSHARRSTEHNNYESRPSKLPSPKTNPIKTRKYQGGLNIKIGRASRFENEGKGLPGPGKYQIQSVFSRHAIKQY